MPSTRSHQTTPLTVAAPPYMISLQELNQRCGLHRYKPVSPSTFRSTIITIVVVHPTAKQLVTADGQLFREVLL